MKAELVPENGDPPIPITKDLTLIGRRPYCDVVIDHESLSKRHSVVVRTDGLLVIRDLATTNGTKVKGQRVRWAALLPDDRIALGAYKLRVYLGPDDMPAPSELPARTPRAKSRKVATPAGTPGQGAGPGLEFPSPSPLGVPVVEGLEILPDDEDSSDDSGWRKLIVSRSDSAPGDEALIDLD